MFPYFALGQHLPWEAILEWSAVLAWPVGIGCWACFACLCAAFESPALAPVLRAAMYEVEMFPDPYVGMKDVIAGGGCEHVDTAFLWVRYIVGIALRAAQAIAFLCLAVPSRM